MKYFALYLVIILSACQPVEKNILIDLDNNQFKKISISADKIEIVEIYDSVISAPYIDYSLDNPPIYFLKSWLSNNIELIGKENRLEIKIFDSSLKRIEIENTNKKQFEEKFIYSYEINYLVEYNLYDDSNFMLASTLVETFRTTTSSKFISINERDLILEELIYLSLADFIDESKKLMSEYMEGHIL